MVYNSWVDLESLCPLNIERIKRYYNEFDTTLPAKITQENLDESKEKIMSARSCLDSMLITLVQLLYDREILKEPTDKILYAWLIDNFGRYIQKLDETENDDIVKFDSANPANSLIGISRLSAYSKVLRTTADSLIYESLLKATEEYKEIKEEKGKIKKEPRTFLYILFQVLSITLGVMGGLTRQETKGMKKGMATTMPLSWQSMMGPSGQGLIKEGYEEQTGRKLDDETMEDLRDLSVDDDLDLLEDEEEEKKE